MMQRTRAVGLGLGWMIGASLGCADSSEAGSVERAPPVERVVQRAESDSVSAANVSGASAGDIADESSGAAVEAAGEGPPSGAPLDSNDALAAGAADAGADADLEVADAGAPENEEAAPSDAGAGSAGDGGALHPGIEDPAPPPPPLPADIVAQSELPFYGVAEGEELSEDDVWLRLEASRAICLGELHDNPFHHNLQRRVLERLGELQQDQPETRGELAIGYEMFQRPFQAPLSAYVRGELSEEEFLERTEYEQRWGADLALYRPLFEANRDQGLAGLALNAPTELTRAIGREGLESLTPELAGLLPALVLDDAEHRAHIFRLFGLTPDDPAAASLENVYRAQVTWDETMAQTTSEWLTGDDARRLLAFAGTAHCHESAIPRRMTRRTGIEMLSATPVLESDLLAFPEDWVGYELLIVLED